MRVHVRGAGKAWRSNWGGTIAPQHAAVLVSFEHKEGLLSGDRGDLPFCARIWSVKRARRCWDAPGFYRDPALS